MHVSWAWAEEGLGQARDDDGDGDGMSGRLCIPTDGSDYFDVSD